MVATGVVTTGVVVVDVDVTSVKAAVDGVGHLVGLGYLCGAEQLHREQVCLTDNQTSGYS